MLTSVLCHFTGSSNWLVNVGYLCLRGYNIQTQHQGQVWIQYLAQG